MDGLVCAGSKDNIMLRVVGSGDLVLTLYYYRWGNGRSCELPELTQLVIGKAGTRVDSQSAETGGQLPTAEGLETLCGCRSGSWRRV